MVIAEINSGLGNQMFQYAAAKSLASHLNTPLLLDISWYHASESAQTPRAFELNVYPEIQESIASPEMINELIRPASVGIVNKIKHRLNRMRAVHRQWAFVEPHFHFYPSFFEARNSVYLSGYWQSEKYFLPIADQIRQTFTLNIPEADVNFNVLKRIQSVNAISIHVRRGDMIKNPDVAHVHGSCNLDYYQRAMKLIEKSVNEPVYFIFSDDTDWCKENLKSMHPLEFITGNEEDRAFWDIQLMRNCKHHITANSSFSWWGAWLNPSASKKVISPLRWFADDSKDTSDLIPADWMRI